ncbi:uncharacterized protein LOC111064777 [Drosophila obscura]|uniref:uncharacterized protein LOC111064777 n=1 Tax=Drosophila obscura TaxID=7282 RepID=UPI000BA1630D|nr:uncharacterized protein LOC111064777 [Drosophila obscura]XP_041450071.1 uncharacterized protein LOC111064777 [Drosophila obscura]
MLAKLPMEIIDKVFGYLEETDQLKLAQVNQQLGFAFAYHARGTYERLHCSHTYTTYTAESNLKVILELCGSTVVDLEIGFNFDGYAYAMNVIFKLIAKHCVNLQSAKVDIKNVNFNACKYLLPMKGLKTIELNFYITSPESDLLQYINPDCKVLTVNLISNYQTQNIRKLINLEKLTVRRSKRDLRDISQILSNLKKLRVLSLQNCTYDPEIQEQEIVYPELVKLELYNCNISTDLPKCPKLKSLSLKNNSYNGLGNICDTIASFASTVEHLIIITYDYDSNKFTAEQFIKTLGECKKLKWIDSNLCSRLLTY